MRRDQARITETLTADNRNIIVRLVECVSGKLLFEREVLNGSYGGILAARTEAFDIAKRYKFEVVE